MAPTLIPLEPTYITLGAGSAIAILILIYYNYWDSPQQWEGHPDRIRPESSSAPISQDTVASSPPRFRPVPYPSKIFNESAAEMLQMDMGLPSTPQESATTPAERVESAAEDGTRSILHPAAPGSEVINIDHGEPTDGLMSANRPPADGASPSDAHILSQSDVDAITLRSHVTDEESLLPPEYQSTWGEV